jgi:hypothetical protein
MKDYEGITIKTNYLYHVVLLQLQLFFPMFLTPSTKYLMYLSNSIDYD